MFYPDSAWRAASAAVIGRRHQQSDIPCQDAAAVCRQGGRLAAVVCDGAGSAPLSHHGAQAVADTLSAYLARQAHDLIIGLVSPSDLIDRALAALAEQQQLHGGELSDYACTLIGLVIDGAYAASLHLGDGVISIESANQVQVLSTPDNGEAANETVFVTSASAKADLRLRVFPLSPDITSFALFTDGAQASLYNYQTRAVSHALVDMANWLQAAPEADVSQHLAHNISQYLIPRTTDDCAAALIRKCGPAFNCPFCGSNALCRGRGGRTRFRSVCVSCRRLVAEQHSQSRSYPQLARAWVHSLHAQSHSQPEIARITKISPATVRRMLR